MGNEHTKALNNASISLWAFYLNKAPDFVTEDMVKEILNVSGTCEIAYAALVAEACGLDVIDNKDHKELYRRYLIPSIKKLDPCDYIIDPYYKNIALPEASNRRWRLGYQTYKPYEAFSCGDFKYFSDGVVLPRIGFFDTEFKFPCVYENEVEWMSVKPNEIETMREPIKKAFGSVLTLGLGLGYFSYMCSLKNEVESVTVVEKSEDAVKLFEEYVLPQFENKTKIKIVLRDAFEYLNTDFEKQRFDFVFSDIWHDPSDGAESYLKIKKIEQKHPETKFSYWIEDTIKYYL